MKRIGKLVPAVGLLVALLAVAAGCTRSAKNDPGRQVVPPGETGLTVRILPNGSPVNPSGFDVHLSKGVVPNLDHMRWKNDSGVQMKLRFTTAWPFAEPEPPLKEIVIENGQTTEWFTLGSQATAGARYPYHLDPNYSRNDGGPTEPSVSADP